MLEPRHREWGAVQLGAAVGADRPEAEVPDAADRRQDLYRPEAAHRQVEKPSVMQASFLPTRFRRSPKMVRQSDRELYHLTLLLDGEMALDHAGRTNTFRPCDLHMVDSSQPYDLRSLDDQEPRVVQGVGVDFPKEMLPLPPHRVRELLGRGLPGQEGVGPLLTELLVGLVRQAKTLQPSDAPRLGTVLLELISAWCAQALDAEAALPPETRQRAMARRVRAFIRQNLNDPELTPSVIAAAHHISLSYLYRIFEQQSQGETVAAWIRNQRLEGARRDLANPALRTTPIHAIAARWGFPRASDFSRAFRTAHQISPKDYRFQRPSERK
ncbi:helix-turn-helix domain-containing protein [Streptomyces sp. NPDC002698]|uniref:helix-turn-helix domain-containing protein n=1 Tax=Streptomyces sp. NPDC002698 TaxID=3364660 RepID=UPI0036A1410B